MIDKRLVNFLSIDFAETVSYHFKLVCMYTSAIEFSCISARLALDNSVLRVMQSYSVNSYLCMFVESSINLL